MEFSSAARFSDVVTSETQLRKIIGADPGTAVANKITTELDAQCRMFITQCPFVLIASVDAQGNMDISPKGDPPGFVKVLDNTTLAIPDRPGNRRADTFTNILQNPKVGLFFLLPGRRETLRITGVAMIVRDRQLRESMAIQGKSPDFAVVVTLEEAFFYCSKSIVRAKIWQHAHWPDPAAVSPVGERQRATGQLAKSA